MKKTQKIITDVEIRHHTLRHGKKRQFEQNHGTQLQNFKQCTSRNGLNGGTIIGFAVPRRPL